MSRYRDDDRDYYGGEQRGGRGWSDDPYGGERRGGRGGSFYDREYGYDEAYGARSRSVGGERDYGREDYGRGGERDVDRYDERRSRDYYDEGRGGERDYDREGDGRSLYDEGRDYLQRRRAVGRAERGRGASRSHVRCRDIMTRDVTVAMRDTTLQEVALMMRDEDTGVIPVVEPQDAGTTTNDAAEGGRAITRTQGQGKLVGLITDRDIVVRALAEGKDARITLAEEVMTTDIHTARPNDRVIDAIRKMGDKQVRRIPVVGENNELRGIISMADVALETEEDRELADALEEISSGSSFWSKIFG